MKQRLLVYALAGASCALPLHALQEDPGDVTTEEFLLMVHDDPAALAEPLYEGSTEVCVTVSFEPLVVALALDGEVFTELLVKPGDRAAVPLPGKVVVGQELHLLDALTGELLAVDPVQHRTYPRGNVVYSGAYGASQPDLDDVVYLAEYLFYGGPEPLHPLAGDVQGDGLIDVQDVFVLYDYILGLPNPVLPEVDLLFDGSPFEIRTFTSNEEEGDWSGEIHAPPRKGEGAKPANLDGNPKTKEWTFPCTAKPVQGKPGYFTITVCYGPRTPGTTPSGGNSALIQRFVCILPNPSGPWWWPFTLEWKPIGQCMFPCGDNEFITPGLVSRERIWTSRNPDNNDTWRYTFNIDTCKIVIERDHDGDGTYNHVHTGLPSEWDGWFHL
ncbi:MAG: hypothetical protein AAF682_04135 [Planctomycetota bacterium]